MSHVVTINMELTDLESLKAACKAMGLEFVDGQTTYKWFGQSVGDYPLPEGFAAEDLGKCEHAIRIPGNSRAYEIGVTRRRDGKAGYTMLWDFWAGGYGLKNAVGEEGIKLRREYAAAVSTRKLQSQGYRVHTNRLESGRIVLRATR